MTGPHFAIRRAVIEYGSIPIAAWLHHIDSTAAIAQALAHMIEAGVMEGGRCLIGISALAQCLDVPEQHSKILVDTLDAVTEQHHQLVVRPGGRPEPEAVDAHAVALFLFAQLYIRQAQRPEAMEVWPVNSSFPANSEEATISAAVASSSGLHDPAMPNSPARSTSSNSSSQGSGRHFHSVQFQHQRSNHLVRRELQAHLQQHAALLQGYTDHMQRHTHAILSLLLNRPLLGLQEGSFQGHSGNITAGEFDRLSFLLRPGYDHTDSDGASPMDISPSPFSEDAYRLSLSVPMFKEAAQSCEAPFLAIAEWLRSCITDEMYPAEAMLGGSQSGDPFSSLPPAGIVQGDMVDIQGVCRSTVVKGEENFPSGTLRVTDCHDTVIYALAALQYASVISCSDCTVVIGAVARMLRVERCERLTLIAASVRVCISTCHECTFYLGVNRPPLLVGDSRLLQMAPYNTQYERLPNHLAAAGIDPDINFWDQPVTLARQHKHTTPDSVGPAGATGTAQSRPPMQLLPPEKLLPFMVPFKGGPGHFCGGAASGGSTRLAADLGSFVGLSDTPGTSAAVSSPMVHAPLPSSPFRLPPAYQEAKERKVQIVTELRQHIKMADLPEGRKRELHTVIQAYFKEWLTSSGAMRQVYDLTRMEREEGGLPASPRAPQL